MSIVKTPQQHYPKGTIIRRAMSLSIDFLGTWLISSFLRSNNIGIEFAQIFVFISTWLIFRVVIVFNNQGQSLGRWAVDLQVLEVDNGQIVSRVPEIQALLQREGILCFSTLLLSICLDNITANPTAILLLLPLVIDCGVAYSDPEMRQALHDRYAKTIIISSQRGYSLDLKIKRLVEKLQQNVRR